MKLLILLPIIFALLFFDDLTKEGYRCIAHDEGKEAGSELGATGGVNSYFYFQKMEYVR